MKAIFNPENGKFRRVELSESEYRAAVDDMTGICCRCGEEQGPVEPDATRYACESCDQPAVYGLEQLLLMGRVALTGVER